MTRRKLQEILAADVPLPRRDRQGVPIRSPLRRRRSLTYDMRSTYEITYENLGTDLQMQQEIYCGQ